jgi:hypothetical protein
MKKHLNDMIRLAFGKYFFLLLLAANGFSIQAQTRLVMNNSPFINISNGAYLVLSNPNANAITLTGTGGNIITEAENNVVRWHIGASTGTYTMPFYDNDNAVKIPFVMNVTSPGNAAGYVEFSTYDNPSWDNNGYRPSDVSNMNSFIGGPNNSSNVIDRFWIIDASSYGTKPSATLSFTYIDAEWSAAGNSITESTLGAQRFNTPDGDWDDYIPQGAVNTATNLVSAVPAAAADFFRSWTLAELSSPLPVELLNFDGACANSKITLKWSTASETNNDYFTLEKSTDGSSYFAIAVINGAGNSSTSLDYFYNDDNLTAGTFYYRLKQTDNNGEFKYYDAITVNSCGENSSFNIFSDLQNNHLHIENISFVDGKYSMVLLNSVGQIIRTSELSVSKGHNSFEYDLSELGKGMYVVSVYGAEKPVTKKIILR